ncbi:MAG: histidinol dehydrogenase [Bacillaceae bacterium]|nr:histidinol dehydrogenase [Bacillaceae bacterium]
MRIVNADELDIQREVSQGTEEQRRIVLDILDSVRREGDSAVRRYTEKFDGIKLASFLVTDEERRAGRAQLDPDVMSALEQAAENIRRYHEKQTRQSWWMTEDSGTILGQMIRPLRRVGIYVPGGTAAYPSSVLMNAIPAQVAGVEEIVMVTPPGKDGKLNPGVLAAADLLGINEIYKVGGAQAVAALAYGTETIERVDKITGPGNIFVALAKREVFGIVDIDMIAGPSEIVVLADDSADPEFVAADLLSQAEHDVMASAVLVTPSRQLAEQVRQEVEKQLAELPRKEIAGKSIEQYGAICVVENLEQGFDVVNRLAPEHLELLIERPLEQVGKVRNAGAVFLGEYSSEPIGDYFAGPNHVLPTNGTARFSSPLHVDDFIKKSSVIYYSGKDLAHNAGKIASLARMEGLEAHARAVEARLKRTRNRGI